MYVLSLSMQSHSLSPAHDAIRLDGIAVAGFLRRLWPIHLQKKKKASDCFNVWAWAVANRGRQPGREREAGRILSDKERKKNKLA
jgi:hypothetical protein